MCLEAKEANTSLLVLCLKGCMETWRCPHPHGQGVGSRAKGVYSGAGNSHRTTHRLSSLPALRSLLQPVTYGPLIWPVGWRARGTCALRVTAIIIPAPGNPGKWQWSTPQATACVETQASSMLSVSQVEGPACAQEAWCFQAGPMHLSCRSTRQVQWGQYSCAQHADQLDSVSSPRCCCLRFGEDRK